MFRARQLGPSGERADAGLSAFQRRRLARSWVYPFRDHVLPLIDEHAFAPFYHANLGAPNRSISLVVAILLLKDFFGLTDEEALECFAFDRRWHIALDVVDRQVSCCQKTLHNFRVLLGQHDKARQLFESLTDQLLAVLDIDPHRQRLDSTHVRSNVACLKRLGLFCESLRLFLRRLRRHCPAEYAGLPEQLRQRYHKDSGAPTAYDGPVAAIARRRLAVVARDLFRLVSRFQTHPGIATWPELATLKRVLAEQCEVLDEPPPPLADDDDVALGPVPLRLRPPKQVPASSLQTPHDPDVTYGNKGQGYEVQICETFANKSEAQPDKPEMITHVLVTPSCHNDIQVTLPILNSLQQRGLRPKELEVDSNYTSSATVEEARRQGTQVNGPVKGNKELPRASDVTLGDFHVDCQEPSKSTCPAGQPLSQQQVDDQGRMSLAVLATACLTCQLASACPAEPGKGKRQAERVVRTTQEEYSCAKRRRYETTAEFRERQAWRAGIEGTNSEMKRRHGLGQLPVRGLPRVQVAVYLKAAACNVKRAPVYLAKQSADRRSPVPGQAALPGDAAWPSPRKEVTRASPGT